MIALAGLEVGNHICNRSSECSAILSASFAQRNGPTTSRNLSKTCLPCVHVTFSLRNMFLQKEMAFGQPSHVLMAWWLSLFATFICFGNFGI